jgi:hypothetical protein
MKQSGSMMLATIGAAVGCGDRGAAPTIYFDLGNTSTPETFWNYPWPSDQRLDESGAPDIVGFPNPRNIAVLSDLLSLVPERRGWPMMPVGYVRFTQPVALGDEAQVRTKGPLALVDIDPSSPERGARFPLLAAAVPEDRYVPSGVVALAPVPGIVLRAATKYAFVITNEDETDGGFGALVRPDSFDESSDPDLWLALDGTGIPRDHVIAATVFTTGDETARVRARSEAVRAGYSPAVTTLQLVGGDTYDGFCRLSGEIAMPQFQTGTPPFDTGGRFVLDDDVPQKQGEATIPVVITLPKRAMPAAGWPLYEFFHGSGGVTSDVVDLGYSPTADDAPVPGSGPAYVVATQGIAAVSAAMPTNPERLANASDGAYLNLNNVAAFPYTLQQGVIEQRLLLDAMLDLRIDESALAGCDGISGSVGGAYFFDPARLAAGGRSIGGAYTNLVGAVEERLGALMPSGAGGYWSYMMLLDTLIQPGSRSLLAALFGIDEETISFKHPALHTLELAWEAVEPFVAMSRLAHRPLPGLPVRNIYEPVGKDDGYFPTPMYDAAAVAFRNQQAGPVVWPTMQTALGLVELDGPTLSYPVSANLDGKTRVVVQFEGDGILDAHYIDRQLEGVKHQYSCFFATYFRDGVPTLPEPSALATPCP